MSRDEAPAPLVVADPWASLRAATPARIALGRAGTSLPTGAHLRFQLAHAKARSAVHRELDTAALSLAIEERGRRTVTLQSRAAHRAAYLQNPGDGRRLDVASAARLRQASEAPCDIAIVVADGLSSVAIEENALPLLDALLPNIEAKGWTSGPIAVVSQARVAVADEIGDILRARLALVLIGERPGLSAADSLGVYMTFAPRLGLTDEARNCISNVRAAGLKPARAADKLLYLIEEAFRRGLSGVELKDEETQPPAGIENRDTTNFLTRR